MTGQVKEKIRTRIAPAPTGPLHIGTARSALFNYIFAQKNQGEFILRIEDTDAERSDSVFEEDIKNALEWLGMGWDEFYRQSDRLDIYEEHLKRLLERGNVFWCPHSEKDLVKERIHQMKKKEPPRHVCQFRDEHLDAQPEKGILRFKNEVANDIVFNDLIRGEVRTKGELLGDFSVAKDIRSPLYNFAVVVDDALMNISHVIRGEDLMPNTAKQILIQSALGFARPAFAHLPLILAPDRSKLSKRHGATSVLEYKKMGYLAEAMVNFMILLGWHPVGEEEIFTMKEMIEQFSLKRVQKGGAVFNIEKLSWMNRQYIKKMSLEDLSEKLRPYVYRWSSAIEKEPEKWKKIVELEKERLTTLKEIGEKALYFFEEPYYSRELLFWKQKQTPENIVRHLESLAHILSEITEKEWGRNVIEKKVTSYADREGRGEVLWPLRVSLSGREASPGPFEIADILGKSETISRVGKAIKLILQ
ncbi:glutamate--tRNA ligase [Patescibacteria group bacterium]|nr:glutamate--tRNA ligase [Patescibacteria group bacterium]